MPYTIAMELLAIRKANSIKQKAIKLMIEHVDHLHVGSIFNCESIMFGPRFKVEGWSLYTFESGKKERAVWTFY